MSCYKQEKGRVSMREAEDTEDRGSRGGSPPVRINKRTPPLPGAKNQCAGLQKGCSGLTLFKPRFFLGHLRNVGVPGNSEK